MRSRSRATTVAAALIGSAALLTGCASQDIASSGNDGGVVDPARVQFTYEWFDTTGGILVTVSQQNTTLTARSTTNTRQLASGATEPDVFDQLFATFPVAFMREAEDSSCDDAAYAELTLRIDGDVTTKRWTDCTPEGQEGISAADQWVGVAVDAVVAAEKDQQLQDQIAEELQQAGPRTPQQSDNVSDINDDAAADD